MKGLSTHTLLKHINELNGLHDLRVFLTGLRGDLRGCKPRWVLEMEFHKPVNDALQHCFINIPGMLPQIGQSICCPEGTPFGPKSSARFPKASFAESLKARVP